MDIKTLKDYCLQKKGSITDYPFGEEALVIKVAGKMFALLPVGAKPPRINLKCDPTWAEVLRQTYTAVTPGYHMSKRHWNTIIVDGSIPDAEIFEMLDHSYELVVKGLSKVERGKLKETETFPIS